jgi:hypothetical protein
VPLDERLTAIASPPNETPTEAESLRGRNHIEGNYFGVAVEELARGVAVVEPFIDAPEFDPVALIVPLPEDPFAEPDPLSVPIGVSLDEFGVIDLSVPFRPLNEASLAFALLALLASLL